MQRKLTIATTLPKAARDFKRASKRIHLTPQALAAIAASVGSLPPETGGMLFGPAQTEGISFFVFDEEGSRRATAVAYAPSVKSCTTEQDRQSNGKPMRLLDGFVHSHPGAAYPSREAGPAQGDLGFARAFLADNEAATRMLMPIVTGSMTQSPVLTPWVVEADDLNTPALADVVVCEEGLFPTREFPHDFAEKAGDKPAALPLLITLNLDHLAEHVGAVVAVDGRTLVLTDGESRHELYLPDRFPLVPPLLTTHLAAAIHFYPVPWKLRSTECVEVRLATVLERAMLCAREV
jgi:hypothetical protein